MKCPYCNGEMELGVLQAGHSILWTPRPHMISLIPRNDGHDLLLDRSSLSMPKVEAFNCVACKRIVINYSELETELEGGAE